MKKGLSTLALWTSLAFWNPETSAVNNLVDINKSEFWSILDLSSKKEIKNNNFDYQVKKELEEHNFSEEQKQVLEEIFSNKEFQDKFYDILKKEKSFSNSSIITSLFLGFLYFYAYYSTIRRVRKEYMPIDIKSFSVFWATSWGMVLVNWFIPWSIVYAESFVLAFTAVWLHLYNRSVWNQYQKEDNLKKLRDAMDLSPFPISKYRDDWYPEIWNKKMVEETWYTYEEVIKYWEEKWEIMTLLYKWENLEKVKRYLQSLSDTWKWYDWVAFTMTTKSGEEKTFLWTTNPYEWWTLRFARVLTDVDEIRKKLKETEEKTYIQSRTDHKFSVLNSKALDEDFIKLCTNFNREKDSKKYTIVMLDLDNFKWVNDKHWHELWDEVLKWFIDHIHMNIRWNDKLYRLWWDEFVIIMDTDNIDAITNHLNIIRKEFHENNPFYSKWDKINVWSSWWLKTINISDFNDDNEVNILEKFKNLKLEIDEYMYWVKYYRLIKEKLVAEWKIQDSWEEKNGIAEPIYDTILWFSWVKITNNYWSFELTKEELEEIESIKKWVEDLRNI